MTKRQLYRHYQDCLEKTKMDEEIFDEIFCTPDERQAFQNMFQAEKICFMHLAGFTYAAIGEKLGLSAGYCSQVVRKAVRIYQKRLRIRLYELSQSCNQSNLEHLVEMSKCAADADPDGMKKLAEALLCIPKELSGLHTKEEQIRCLMDWMEEEFTE